MPPCTKDFLSASYAFTTLSRAYILKMVLIIEKAQEADIQRLLDIMYVAFSKDPWNRIMFPVIPGPEARGASIERWGDEILMNPTIHFMKVVDTDMNEIVAFARWNVYQVERSESDWKITEPRNWDIGTNVEAANEFYNVVCGKRQSFMGGNPHCRLNMLVCEPQHQRKGAGRMLLN
ncbi:MAG: hypothetical protein ASARMPREDX12_003686 [Alectoria sarmentosa]|nr:MAG: hypothetical protein ASARMPREDX12_003686 [Alectoria sarmentosa]